MTEIREEGQKCSFEDCIGVLGYRPVENCSCHMRSPCPACTSNPLQCLACGWGEEDESPRAKVFYDRAYMTIAGQPVLEIPKGELKLDHAARVAPKIDFELPVMNQQASFTITLTKTSPDFRLTYKKLMKYMKKHVRPDKRQLRSKRRREAKRLRKIWMEECSIPMFIDDPISELDYHAADAFRYWMYAAIPLSAPRPEILYVDGI